MEPKSISGFKNKLEGWRVWTGINSSSPTTPDC